MYLKLNKKFFIMLSICIVFLCASLPFIDSGFQDITSLQDINIKNIEKIDLYDNENSFPKRISLIGSKMYDNDVQIIGFVEGTRFTIEAAIKNMLNQIDVLYKNSLMPESSQIYIKNKKPNIYVGGIELAVDNYNPSCNLILWNITVFSNKYSIDMKIDDETGKILMYNVYSSEPNLWYKDIDMNELKKRWASYLELDIYQKTISLEGERAKKYMETRNNIILKSNIYNKQSNSNSKMVHFSLTKNEDLVSYILYKDEKQFSLIVE